MKLQSQATRRFDQTELRRLAKATRPTKPWPITVWIAAGAAIGTALVIVVRVLGV